jgi:hypothetical protein
MLVSHNAPFLAALQTAAEKSGVDLAEVRLVKDLGETRIEGQATFQGASWTWPKR